MEEGLKPGSRSPNTKFGRDNHTQRNSRPDQGNRKHDATIFHVEGNPVELKNGRVVEPGVYSADHHGNWVILEELEAGTIPGVFVIHEHASSEVGKEELVPKGKTHVDEPVSHSVVKQSRRGPVVSTNEPRQRVDNSNVDIPKTIIRIERDKTMMAKTVDGKCRTGCRCSYCVPDEGSRTRKHGEIVNDAIKM